VLRPAPREYQMSSSPNIAAGITLAGQACVMLFSVRMEQNLYVFTTQVKKKK
jgi:hypothetical protein